MESLMRRLAITTVVIYSGWALNKMNYTDWANWGYDEPRINRQLYSVFEVNKTDYESCSTDHPLYNISKEGGRDVYQVNHSRPYYFISGGGFCWQGMKLTVVVHELPLDQQKHHRRVGQPLCLQVCLAYSRLSQRIILVVSQLGVHR
ncbi:hypothetical protein MKW92_038678 [Papaver armeniacum]|nr:hypothetical protein MKW92_038678 [Papaver armeniacum]